MNEIIEQFLVDAEQLKYYCQQKHIRSMLLLSGDIEWCEHIASLLFSRLNHSNNASVVELVQWVSNDLPDEIKKSRFVRHIHRSKADSLLGNDTENVVINCFDGLNPNLLASISGTLKGGGFIVLLTPSLQSWASFDDPDYQRYAMTRPTSVSLNEKPSGYFLRRFIHAVEMQQVFSDRAISKSLTDTAINVQKSMFEVMVFEQTQENTFLSKTPFLQKQNKPEMHSIKESNVAYNVKTVLPATQVRGVELKSVSVSSIKPTSDQLTLINRVNELLAKPKGVLVVKADRGRGKSTALGIAIAKLIQSKNITAIITSPQRNHVNHFFSGLLSADKKFDNNKINAVRYLPPDKLADILFDKVEADVVIVDEAAALALSLLYKLRERFSRVIFATTMHGYEGSGRGFYLRFLQYLRKETQHLDELVLSKPCRWSENCGLEVFIDRLLCIKPEVSALGYLSEVPIKNNDEQVLHGRQEALKAPNISIRKVSKTQLLTSEPLLQSVFALLVQAHYQTQPNDLRLLLDQPYSHLWIAEQDLYNESDDSATDDSTNDRKKIKSEEHGQAEFLENTIDPVRRSLVAVLFVIEEGGFEPDQNLLAIDIAKGIRRPKGNLVAQKLAHQSGDSAWCALKGMRVVRVAVSEPYRLQGIASLLLNTLADYCRKQSIDYWSSSFAYDPQTAGFWMANKALPVHLGMHLDKASAARNLLVIKPLSGSANALAIAESFILRENIPLLGSRFLPEFDEPALASLLLWLSNSLAFSQQHFEWQRGIAFIEQYDEQQLIRYTRHELPVASVYPALSRWVSRARSDSRKGLDYSLLNRLNDKQQQFLKLFLRQAPLWASIAKEYGLTGRKQIFTELAAVIRCLVDLN